MTTVAAVILAAGAGTRIGRPKADLELNGVRLLDRAVAAAQAAGCSPVIAVVRAGTAANAAQAVVNPAPERGLRSSLELAVAAAPDADAIAVLLVDMPGVTADAIRAVVAGWRAGRVAIARFPERSGHPVVMSPAQWREALAMADEDGGARRYLAAHPHLVDEITVAGSGTDIDTPQDLAAWRRTSPDH